VQIRYNSDLIEALAVLTSLAASYESLAFDDLVATLPENAIIQQKIPDSIRVGTTCNLIWHEPKRPSVILITNENKKGEVRVIFHPEILISSTLLAMAGEKYKMKIMGEIRYKTRGPLKPPAERDKRITNLLASAREGAQAHKVCKEALNGLSIEKSLMSQISSQL